MISDFINLFYPKLCLACSHNHVPAREWLCLPCQLKLPKTNFHLMTENELTERFWGRLQLVSGAAMYFFVKGGRTQQMIHNLKYKGKKSIAIELGKMYGKVLKEIPTYQGVDLIIPVPLHPKKEKHRGFNQSKLFAIGLSESMKVTWSEKYLRRKAYTATQTQKSRQERLENVLTQFEVRNPAAIRGKHLLLVDDVITTGATMEACGMKLLEIPQTRLSLAAIAIAEL